MTPADVAALVDAMWGGMVLAALVGIGSSLLTVGFIDLLQMTCWRARARARRKRLAAIRARRMLAEAQQAVLRG